MMPDRNTAFPRIDWTLNAGNIGQMILVAFGILIWFLNGNTKSDQTQRDLAAFQGSVTGQLAEIKATVDKRFDNVQAQISSIPVVSVQLAQLDHRLSAAEERNAQEDTRLGAVEQIQTGLQHDMQNIKSASGTQITPGHR